MNPKLILWIYIVLVVIGGIIGFVKAKSSISLVTSAAFAAALALCAVGIITPPWVPEVLLAVLLIVFAMRLAKTKKFMPAGLMLILTVLAFALRHL